MRKDDRFWFWSNYYKAEANRHTKKSVGDGLVWYLSPSVSALKENFVNVRNISYVSDKYSKEIKKALYNLKCCNIDSQDEL